MQIQSVSKLEPFVEYFFKDTAVEDVSIMQKQNMDKEAVLTRQYGHNMYLCIVF